MVVPSKINRPNNTSMASIKLLFLFILASFLSFATSEEQYDPFYLYQNCSSNKTTANSIFQFDLRTLLSSLQSNATGNTEFYKTIVTGRNPSDSVYGLFMCRGDVPSQLCQQCVVNATQRLSSECSLSKQAVIWYDECMVRYSNRSFFSTVDTRPRLGMVNTGNISNQESFMSLLFKTINRTADEAANYPIGAKKYATKQAWVSGFRSLYCLVQCTQDLSSQDCRSCLSRVIGDLPWCSEGKQGGRVLYPSCNIRYELYPFYRSTIPAPTPTAAAGLVPATKTSYADSKFSEDPGYLSHNCSSDETVTTYDAIKFYLSTLLFYLSSNATSGKKFWEAGVDNTAYSLFMCRGDIPPRLCGLCVLNATDRISSECRSSTEAIIWYSHCLLRYSYRYFFSMVDRSPIFYELNVTSTSNPNQELSFFSFTLSNMLTKVAEETADGVEKFVTKSLKLNALQTLYTLAQCTQDLSRDDCKGCLSDVIGSAIPWSRLGSVGGRVLYPSCNVRFELFQFYRDGDEAQAPRPDTKRHKLLSWFERHNIVGGIARGILYLHEYSRLKVIHRDLKPSNVLLDENMIPKISDFGLARIIDINQDQGSTDRIVGTYGYMSPEYAMLGQFSEKSDVFSFGVMVLEIITGKKNISSFESHSDGLLNYVWRQWRTLTTLDPNIKDNYSEIEVIKFIQISLLCVQQSPDVRPTIATVVSCLSSHSIELPSPQEPGFLLHSEIDPIAVAEEPSSNKSINSSTPLSINEMSISEFLPR